MKSIRSSLWCCSTPILENINHDLRKTFSSHRGPFKKAMASKVRVKRDKSSESIKSLRLLVQINKNEAQPSLLTSIQSVQGGKEFFQEFSDSRILAKLGSKIELTGYIVSKSIAYFLENCLPSLTCIEKCIDEFIGLFSKSPPGQEKRMVNSNSHITINMPSLLDLQSDGKEIDQPLKIGHKSIYMSSTEPIDTEFYDSEVDFLYSTPGELDQKIHQSDEILFSASRSKDRVIGNDIKDFEDYMKKCPVDKSPCVWPETTSLLSILNSVDKSAVIIHKDCYITNRILDSLKKKEEKKNVKDNENIGASSEKTVNYILSRQGVANLSDLLLLTDKSNASLLKRAVEKAKQNSNSNFLFNETDINGMLTTTDKSLKVNA